MSKLIEFYNKVITSFDLKVTDDMVYVNNENLTIDDLPVALPTNKILGNMLDFKGNRNYYLFNPIIEEVYTIKKNSNPVLTSLTKAANINLVTSLTLLGSLIVRTSDLKKASMNITDFGVMVAKEVNNNSIKKIIDDRTISFVTKVLEDNMDTEYTPIKLKLVKNSKIDEDKYGMVCTVYSPMLDYILEEEKKDKIEEIFNIKVRPKDIAVLKAILKFLLGVDVESDYMLKVGSNSSQPGLDSLLKLYHLVSEWFNSISKDLKSVDLKDSQDAEIPLAYTLEDIENIPTIEPEAKMIISNEYSKPLQQEPKHNSLLAKAKQVNESTNKYVDNVNVPKVQEQELSEFQKFNMSLNKGVVPVQPVYNTVPDYNAYTGPRPDLHVTHIYNAAPTYQPGSTYYGNSQPSRLDMGNPYVSQSAMKPFKSLADKQQENMYYSNLYGNPYLR